VSSGHGELGSELSGPAEGSASVGPLGVPDALFVGVVDDVGDADGVVESDPAPEVGSAGPVVAAEVGAVVGDGLAEELVEGFAESDPEGAVDVSSEGDAAAGSPRRGVAEGSARMIWVIWSRKPSIVCCSSSSGTDVMSAAKVASRVQTSSRAAMLSSLSGPPRVITSWLARA
jgi:hypothetical protein